MTRRVAALALALFLSACTATYGPPADPGIPWEPVPPPPTAPLPPPPPPAPPTEPTEPPSAPTGILEKVRVGMTPDEVRAALNAAPLPVPQHPSAPWTLRFEVKADGLPSILWVLFENGRVIDRGLAPIITVP